MSKSTRDFRFKQFNLVQRVNAMKFGTDSAILGAIASMHEPKRILDIGTGTGILALMLAQRYPTTEIIGVELDKLSAEEAKFNFENSPWKDHLQLVNSSIQNFRQEGFDLIVSNPPFFENSYKNEDRSKRRARHTDDLSLEDLIKSISAKLTASGLSFLIYPSAIAPKLLGILTEYDLHLVKEWEVYSYPDSEKPVRTIFVLAKTKEGKIKQRINIYQSQRFYSEEFILLLKPYYLHL